MALTRRKLISRLFAVLLLLIVGPVDARLLRGTAPAFFATPKSGLVITDASMFPFVNFMRMTSTNNAATSAYPGNLNAANLPNGSLATTLNYVLNLPSNYLGKMVLALNGTLTSGGFEFTVVTGLGASGQIYSATGATLTGCSNGGVPPCVWGNTITITGTNPVVTFDFSTPITGATNNGSNVVHIAFTNVFGNHYQNGQAVTTTGVVGSDGNGCGSNGTTFTLANVSSTGADLTGSTFPAGCTYTSGGQIFPFAPPLSGGGTYSPGFSFNTGSYSSMTTMVMCKLADYTADNTCNTTAGKSQWTADGFNDDFITSLASANPRHLRYLDVNSSVFRVATDFSHWPTPSTAWSYNLVNDFWISTRWFGSTSGTNSYSLTCNNPCNYTLTGSAPVDGDYFQFFNVNANTGMSPTLTITDSASVTSSPIPIFDQSADHYTVRIGGTITAGDTISLQFNTTNLTATTCLAGNTHTTAPYTVQAGDTTGSIQSHLVSILQADTTLSPLPLDVIIGNPFNGTQTFYIGYANNACALAITPVIGGASPTETVTIGPVDIGLLKANTLYTGQYVALMGGIVVNTFHLGSGTSVAWPWSTQINLAKAISTKTGHGVGCWLQIPLYWTVASYQALATYENSNQCPGGVENELGNEIWNPGNLLAGQASNLANSIGLGNSFQLYQALRSRQLWGAGKTIYGSIGSHFYPTIMYQLGNSSSSALQGTGLCGTSCSNPAYQAAIGVDYNSSPNQPAQFSYAEGQAPYYNGSIAGAGYSGSSSYGTWSATNSSVSGNVLTVAGTVTGTIFWNQGISSCDGAYIAAPAPTNPASAQLTGTVTTTLNGAMTENQNSNITLTSVAGLSPGMWFFNQTTGFVNGVINTINAGAKTINVNTSTLHNTYKSAGVNDTVVFGGGPGTYQLNSTSCSASSGTITGGDVLGFQYAIDNYNRINGALGSVNDGLAWLNQDIRLSVQNSNMYAHNTLQTSAIDDANSINATAVANSQIVWDYEGGLQLQPPTSAQATNMGLPSSAYGNPNGYAGNLFTAFYNSSFAYNLELSRHTLELGILPAGSMTMYYVYSSNYPFGLFPAGLYSTPFQTFDAVQFYNSH
jgi:hypothetical protein